jgi:hypothetical protein
MVRLELGFQRRQVDKTALQLNGRKASSTKPKTFTAYKLVVSQLNGFDGIGYLLSGDLAAIDVDDCRDAQTENIHPWAQALIDRCHTYCEITPSGSGVRIIGTANGEFVHRKQAVGNGITAECYHVDLGRYITITGLPVRDLPLANIDLQLRETVAELDRIKKKGKQPKPEDGDADDDELQRTIRDGGENRHGATRSEAVWYVVNTMLRRGYAEQAILRVLLDRSNKISAHIYDQANPERYAKEQIKSAKQKIDFSRNDHGAPFKTQANVRISLLKMGVSVRYNEFSDQTLISGLSGFGPILDDAAIDRMWLMMDQRGLKVSENLARTVIMDTARLNSFHAVLNYLDSLKWDRVERIDTWLTTYGGAEDNDYVHAVGALLLVAAVRRVRQPGCKFDEMVVIEIEEQGTNKFTALATLAVKEEWFEDDLPLNIEGKRVIESLRGRWIVEAAELSGMKRADIEHLKAFLSRQNDRARLAYGRLTSEVARQCVFIGTTNSSEYLRDTSGNRRFWPVRCKVFNIAALRRDRDQLWAEAAAREATGVSIRLDEKLWPEAAKEQEQRLTRDPWFDALLEALGNFERGKISMKSIWAILDVRGGQQTQEASRRVGEAMRKFGWRRANTGGTVKIDGELLSGYVRGEKPPWPLIDAYRDEGGNLCVIPPVL